MMKIGMGMLIVAALVSIGAIAEAQCVVDTSTPTYDNGAFLRYVPCDATGAQKITGSSSGSGTPSGSTFYSIRKENLTTASANLAFGFTSKKVSIVAPPTNTDDVCVDFAGGTAACPAANTAGNRRFRPGTSILLDDHAITSLSAIAASGTQTISIDAW